MLEISCFFDAHFHFFECLKYEKPSVSLSGFEKYYACSCAHSVEQWFNQKNALETLKSLESQKESEKKGISGGNSPFSTGKIHILKSFGLHPQNPVVENAEFLENLLKNNELDAVGEAGFDLFTDEFRQNFDRQKEVWHIQVELAAKYQKPLIVHCRKAMQYIFQEINTLSKIPSVLFHSFPGPIEEARSDLCRLPDAFFSYGKQILNGNKKVLSFMQNLPLKNILLETDAPFQHLKDERFTPCAEIKRVYRAAFDVRKELSPEIIKNNFFTMFGL